jgi:hypothetical protein
MKISFEKSPLIIQSDNSEVTIKIIKYDKGEATFKVKAIGTSKALEYKYKNRAISGDSGDFIFEEQVITMEEEQQFAEVQVKINNTERIKDGAKYFTIKLVNIDEDYAFEPNSICQCYIVKNIKEYLLENVERYNLPLTKIVNNVVGGVVENEDKEGGGQLKKVELKTRLLLKTNDEEGFANNFPVEIWKNITYGNEQNNLIKCKESGLYKIMLLTSYTPGAEYKFEYEISSLLKNTSDVIVHLIDVDVVMLMKVLFLEYSTQTYWETEKAYTKAISYAKTNSFVTKLSEKVGEFTITPTPSRKILSFSSRDNNNKPDGIGFSYDKKANKITLKSF